MSDTDVQIALERATAGLEAPADLLDRVRRGGRRRLLHRRAAVGAALAVTLVALTGALVVRPPAAGELAAGPSQGRPADLVALMQRSPGGKLAGDAAFRAMALERWTALRLSAPIAGRSAEDRFPEQPTVLWAGDTPAGRAAFVAQWERTPDEWQVRIGFLEPGAAGRSELSRDIVLTTGWAARRPLAMLLGSRRDTLVVLDTGVPVELSKTYSLTTDGRVRRSFQPLTFTDGAAVATVPAQSDEFTIALRVPGDHTLPITYDIGNYGGPARPDDKPEAKVVYRSLPGGPPRGLSVQWESFDDPEGRHTASADPAWNITAGTPDGRLLVVWTLQYGNGPRRIIYGLGASGEPLTAIYGGAVDADGPLGVRLRLPDRQGVLVAAETASLKYRVGSGAWQKVVGDTALLPAEATQVQVLSFGTATPVTVDLP